MKRLWEVLVGCVGRGGGGSGEDPLRGGDVGSRRCGGGDIRCGDGEGDGEGEGEDEEIDIDWKSGCSSMRGRFRTGDEAAEAGGESISIPSIRFSG